MIADAPPAFECEECGSPFTPTRKRFRFCCKRCSCAANGRLGSNARKVSLEDAYEAYVVRNGDDECWDWTASFSGNYPAMKRDGVGSIYAHRFSWERENGKIPQGLIIRHKCDNPRCSNPRHLELGTFADNMADMVKRGRARMGASNPASKLTTDQVSAIKTELSAGSSQRSLARKYGVCQQNISNINRGIVWGAVEAAP